MAKEKKVFDAAVPDKELAEKMACPISDEDAEGVTGGNYLDLGGADIVEEADDWSSTPIYRSSVVGTNKKKRK